MPRLTTEATATALEDGIYVIGGYDEEGEGVQSIVMAIKNLFNKNFMIAIS